MPKFYSLDSIHEKKANWNLIIGRRNNGKTTAVLVEGVKRFFKNNYKIAYLRRYEEEFRFKKRTAYLFNALTEVGRFAEYPLGVVQTLSKGKYNTVVYSGREWFFGKMDEKGVVKDKSAPFCMAFSLHNWEKDKGLPELNFGTIVFDEFITDGFYLVDEFVILCNMISTLVRTQDIAKMYLLGNTINPYCPYFKDMGLTRARSIEKGEIQLYKYGDGKMRVAIERIGGDADSFKSDVLFAFDNPKLNMITKGDWQIANYPRCPVKYRPIDVIYTSYLFFDSSWYSMDIVNPNDMVFLHIKECESNPDIFEDTLVYSTEYDARANYRRNMLQPIRRVEQEIRNLFIQDKAFYDSNYTGEAMRNYLMWCKNH